MSLKTAHSLLITGADPNRRIQKARDLLKEVEIDDIEHPRVILLKPQKNIIPISKVREVKSIIKVSPGRDLRVVVLIEAQTLTVEAQNSLLKTLEEPPKMTRFILTAPHHRSVVPTIKSRCLIINISRDAEEKESLDFVQTVLAKKGAKRLSALEKNINMAEKQQCEEFLDAVELILSSRLRQNPKNSLTAKKSCLYLWKAKKNLALQNANTKLIFETLALSLPQISNLE